VTVDKLVAVYQSSEILFLIILFVLSCLDFHQVIREMPEFW